MDSHHAESVHLIGVIAYQSGKYTTAVELINKAIGLDNGVAKFHMNLGSVLRDQGKPTEAVACFERALALKPDYPQAHNNLGNALRDQGRLTEAVACYKRALALKPDFAEVHNNLGNALREQGELSEAVLHLKRALALKPDFAEVHKNLGNALQDQGKLIEAVVSYERALALKPDFAEAHNNLGDALRDQGKLTEAVLCYERALTLKPDFAEAHVNLGNILRNQGKLTEAVSCYERALALKPNFAEAHNNLGNACQDQGKLTEAVACYERAVTLKADDAGVHNNLGNALREQGKLNEAMVHLERALALKPDFAEAHNNHGNVLRDQGKLVEAVSCYKRALVLKPDYYQAHNNLGDSLREQGKLNEAMVHLERALALKPDFAEAHNNLGNVLRDQGRLTEAQDTFLEALRLEPDIGAVYLNLADFKKFAPGDPHLAAMESLAANPDGLSKVDRMQLDFGLGKAYADLEDYDLSFRHLLAGNAAKRAAISYDEKSVIALFDRIEATFTRELIEAKSGNGDPSALPIFVIGMPRSGTTLVEQIIASHPSAYGAGELGTFTDAILTIRGPESDPLQYPEFVPAIDAASTRQIGTNYISLVRPLAAEHGHADAERITDKMPSNYYFTGLIHLVLPNAKIIHTIRDPVDTCISCFSKLFSAEQNHTYNLAELGRYYRRYQQLMAHWGRVLPAGRILDVRYEDVIADLEGQARRILACCGLPWDDRCLAFHKTNRPVRTASATQVRQPIYKSAVGRWRVYEAHLGPLLSALDAARSSQQAGSE